MMTEKETEKKEKKPPVGPSPDGTYFTSRIQQHQQENITLAACSKQKVPSDGGKAGRVSRSRGRSQVGHLKRSVNWKLCKGRHLQKLPSNGWWDGRGGWLVLLQQHEGQLNWKRDQNYKLQLLLSHWLTEWLTDGWTGAPSNYLCCELKTWNFVACKIGWVALRLEVKWRVQKRFLSRRRGVLNL